MLRTTLQHAWLKRTIRPLYAYSQSTPKGAYLDPAWDGSVPIYPGMAMAKTVGENITLVGDGATAPNVAYGLSAFFEGAPEAESEVSMQGVNACAVWVLAPDAEFEILDPAFDVDATWSDPGTGAPELVHAWVSSEKRGQLIPASAVDGTTITTAMLTSNPVARLLRVNSPTKITVGGLDPTSV